MRSVLLLVLVSCGVEEDLGDPRPFDAVLPTVSSLPRTQAALPLPLTVEPLVAGWDVRLRVNGADPGDTVWFGRGAAPGAGPCIPSLGVCLGIEGPVDLLGTATADASGEASLLLRLPARLPLVDVHLQAVAGGGGVAQLSEVVTAPVVEAAEDLDGDGWCGGAACLDPLAQPGDCNDDDPAAHPGQTAYFETPTVYADGSSDYDYDCDGVEEGATPEYFCVAFFGPPFCSFWEEGWILGRPACGEIGTLADGCVATLTGGCVSTTFLFAVERCR
jgi:hypothetical protein